MNKTSIKWATQSLNVVHGCSKPAAAPPAAFALPQEIFDALYPNGIEEKWTRPNSSPECCRCYAEGLSNKKGWTPKPWLECHAEENVQLHPERFREIGKLPACSMKLPPSERERVFICSMGDIFHERVPDAFLRELWDWLLKYPHIYQLLTKRPERAAEWPGPWPDHIWLGTTCGHPVTKWRIEYLRRSQAKVRFLSVEPLLASMLPIDLNGIHQVIVGGESGDGHRKMEMAWARELRDECARMGVAYFYKQDSSLKAGARPYLVEEDGRCMQYRQFPGEMTAPVLVKPSKTKPRRELLPILG
jgi:protein gp37